MKNKVFKEDHEAWAVFGKTELRWVFNKLEIALRQNLHAGPAGTAPNKTGTYISRPIYNPYGMGVGAKKFFYSEGMYEQVINHDIVPPGHFWCEWLEGPHLSIDYRQKENGLWYTESMWEGSHASEENLTKFSSWEKLDPNIAPTPYLWGNFFPWLKEKQNQITEFNIETRSEKIIEAHLRLGNSVFEDLPIGTTLIPLWEDDLIPEEGFLPNTADDMEIVYEKKYLNGKRKGFKIVPQPYEL